MTIAGPLGPDETLDLKLTAPGPVPVDGVAAVINVTLDGATAKSFLTVWPAGEPRPLASTNNAEPGLITPNSMIAKLGTNGSISIFNAAGSTHVVIDVVGYLVPLQKVAVTGAQFLVGTTEPAATLGQVGDTYFNTVAKVLYGPKGVSGWGQPSSLAGSQGPVGRWAVPERRPQAPTATRRGPPVPRPTAAGHSGGTAGSTDARDTAAQGRRPEPPALRPGRLPANRPAGTSPGPAIVRVNAAIFATLGERRRLRSCSPKNWSSAVGS